MMRPIDADELLKELEEWEADLYDTNPKRQLGVTDAIVIACQMPTVDAAHVIRCKDCEHWVGNYHYCEIISDTFIDWNADDYCSRAERKEE